MPTSTCLELGAHGDGVMYASDIQNNPLKFGFWRAKFNRMTLNKRDRLRALLHHLAAGDVHELPPGVGLRTALDAKALGLVDITMSGRVFGFRLTEAGKESLDDFG